MEDNKDVTAEVLSEEELSEVTGGSGKQNATKRLCPTCGKLMYAEEFIPGVFRCEYGHIF